MLDLCQVEPNSRLPLPGAKLDVAGWLAMKGFFNAFEEGK